MGNTFFSCGNTYILVTPFQEIVTRHGEGKDAYTRRVPHAISSNPSLHHNNLVLGHRD